MVPQDEAKILEKGRLGPGEMLAVDMDAAAALQGPRAQGHAGRHARLRRVDDPHGRARFADQAGHAARAALLARRAAPPAVLGRLVGRGSRDDPPSDVRGRQGSHRLDGRRRAARGAVRHLSRHAPLLPAEFQPGHQPADRQLARAQRHDDPHAARQSRQHPRRDRPSRARCCRCSRRSCSTPSSRRCASTWATPPRASTAPSRSRAGWSAMRQAFDRICKEAEDAVRSGCLHIVLTDANVDADRAALPMILAAGCVHSYLVRQSLRTFTSLNVRSAECLDVHYAAVIIGVGATTVNPYLAEETIAARHARGLFGKLTLGQCLANYKKALDEGLLKTMSKMGISVLSSYRGGCNFEAVGLSRSLVAGVLPRHALAHLGHRPARRAGEDRRAACARVRRGRDRPADRRLLQVPPRRRSPQFRGQPHPHAAGRGEHRVLRQVQEVQRGGAPPAADQPARPAGLQGRPQADLDRRGRVDHRAAQAPGGARHLAGRARPRGARDAVDRHEPHRRQVRFRRRRRGSGALPAAAQRRQRLVGDQAGGVGPLRRHGGVSQQLPRARDQGRAGRQARRGRPAAGPQGQRDDRQAAPFDAGRDA